MDEIIEALEQLEPESAAGAERSLADRGGWDILEHAVGSVEGERIGRAGTNHYLYDTLKRVSGPFL